MIGPTELDPFATKGLEYLLVIAYLAALVLFWGLLRRPRQPALTPQPVGVQSRPGGEWFRVVEDVFYHPGHSWARPVGDVVRLGIDDFAQKLVGRPEAVELPPIGTRVEQGERLCGLRIDSHRVDIVSPVAGEVVRRNPEIFRSPELLNDDPYGRGWLIEVRASRLRATLKGLLHGGLARLWTGAAERELRTRISGELGLLMQDGGVPVDGIARAISRDRWPEIVAEFLLSS